MQGFSVKIDGLKMASLRPDQSIEITLPAGPHAIEIATFPRRKSISVEVPAGGLRELFTLANCFCKAPDYLYLGETSMVQESRCLIHEKGASEFLKGFGLAILQLIGIGFLSIGLLNIRFAIQHHSVEVLKLFVQFVWLGSAMLTIEPAHDQHAFIYRAVFNPFIYCYCAVTTLVTWHICRNKNIRWFKRLLWSIFTISASALLALVVPAAIYWFKYNRPLRISSGYIKIAALSAIGVVCSILIEPIGDFFLLIAMTYTTSVACGFSQEATIFFEECLIPMSWSLVTGSWFRQGKSPVARADAK